jgi:hypothetical protein
MMNRFAITRAFVAGMIFGLPLAVAIFGSSVRADEFEGNDLRNIRVGMAAADLPKAGYIGFACATEPERALPNWENWRDCPADANGTHAVRFDYDPETTREGTMVAGHPAVLTLSIDNAGSVVGLQIVTDPKARLRMRKKAFLLGKQAKSRYGADGWACKVGEPSADEQPVGGVYVKEECTKTISGRTLIVERKLFRRTDQDMKSFVDETRISITQTKG